MEVATPGQGVNGHPPPSSASAIIDPEIVVRHLVDLLEITLGATRDDLERKGSLLSEARKSDTVQRCTRYASESQVALYVQKTVIATDLPNGSANGHGPSGMLCHNVQQSAPNSIVQRPRLTTSILSPLRYHSHPQLSLQ